MSELKVTEYQWGQMITGNRASLIAERVVDPAYFPGDPGNRKTSVRYQADEKWVQVRRLGPDRFEVHRDYPDDLTKRTALARLAEEEREENVRNHHSRARLPQPRSGYCSWLATQLVARYPTIELLDVQVYPCGEAFQQQAVFCAPVAQLVEAGLLTQGMIDAEWEKPRKYNATTPAGDSYLLFGNHESAKLHLYSASYPRLQVRLTRDAARELRRFTLRGSNARARA